MVKITVKIGGNWCKCKGRRGVADGGCGKERLGGSFFYGVNGGGERGEMS